MADGIDTSIALKVQTPNMMNTLGNIASTAGALQQVKQGQMDLEERNKLRDLSKNLGQYKTEDGSLDMNRLVNDAVQTSPKLGAQWAQQIASAHVEGIAVNKELNNLSEQQRGIMGQTVLSVADQPYDMKEKVIGAVVQANPRLKVWGDMALKHLKGVANDPEASKQLSFQIAKATVGIHEQNQLNTPEFINTGAKNINKNPMASGPQEISNTPPPTQEFTDKQGRRWILGDQAGTTKGPIPVSQSPQEATERPVRTQQRIAINTAASKVAEMEFNNDQIVHLADVAFTGAGAAKAAKVFASVGLPWDPKDMSSNAQKLSHFMALQAQNNAVVMGAGTDAARAVAEQATGSKEWDPKAIKATAKINNALSTGLGHFNMGMEKARKANNNDDLSVGEFQNLWSQNFDVNIERLVNADRKNDKEEYEAIIKSLGGKNSPQMQQLKVKMKNLESLTHTGALPK